MLMKKVYVIAEAGVNHNGNMDNAIKMVEEARKAGADAIKFQTFISENLVTKHAEKAEYQKETTDKQESQYQMLKKLELKRENYSQLKKECERQGIDFLSTPFDLDSIDVLEALGVSAFKIPSGEITNYPYLVKIAKTKKKVYLSTGMSTLEEVQEAVNVLRRNGTKDIVVLHCNTQYPTPLRDANLKAIHTLENYFRTDVGYSDHTLGIEVAVAAVAMGASVIEKHFTLDRNMEGPDHKASVEPNELAQMISYIRNVELAMGDGVKEPTKSESENIAIARKSIVARRKIKKGEIFTEDNLTVKRPGTGINPMKWLEVLGKEATKDFEEDDLIEI